MRRIARGGHCTVHQLISTIDGSRAALKTLRLDSSDDAGAVERFLREARALLRVRHPSIVEVLDVGQVDSLGAFFVVDYVDGDSVRALLDSGVLELRVALRIAIEMALALDAVHACGVVHRDLKPDNVMVLPVDRNDESLTLAKLIDFGIASIVGDLRITSSWEVIGTPGYMSPEYVREGAMAPSSDQYSLGVLLYEMLSGRLPFDASTSGQLLVRQATSDPIPLRERLPAIDPGLNDAIMRAIAYAPDARHPSIAEFRGLLESALDRSRG